MQANREEGLADFEQRAWYQTWLNRAFGMMLVEQNLLSKEDYQKIDRGLVSVQARETMERFKNAAPGMDIYFYYENALYEEIGMDTACKLHVGRSRNDIYFTLWRMSLREAALHLMEEAVETQKAIEKHASENLDTIIPFYTYGQPAQPGTWAHYLMTIHAYLESDLERLRHAYATINKCPMGAAAGIGTAFHLNKYRVAELLGFDGTLENTTVANAAADYFLELISDMAILNTTLGRVGSDLAFFSSAECNILDGDAAVCSGSSIMPQKKNPDIAELARGKSGRLIGDLTGLMATLKGLPTAYARDLQEDKEAVFDQVDTLEVLLPAFTGMVATMRFDTERLAAEAPTGFALATDIAEWLVKNGVPFRHAHELSGACVKIAEGRGVELWDLTDEDFISTFAAFLPAEVAPKVREVLSSDGSVASRNGKGGTSYGRVREQIADAKRETEELKVFAESTSDGPAYKAPETLR